MGTNKKRQGFNERVVAILSQKADESGLSYRALSDLSGVSKTKLQAIFTGERDMLVTDMEAVAKALGLVPWHVMKDATRPTLSAVEDSFEGPDESLLAADTSEEETEQ